MAIKFTNNASSTLASSISSSATTITLASGGGSLFPSLGGSDWFYGTLVDSSNNLEIVKVTARSGDVLTVVRGQDGTTANAYIGGDKFELRPVAAALTEAAEGSNIVDLPISQGGTGSSTAAGARANLDVLNDPGSNGFVARTADNVGTARTITAGAGISVTDGDGATGDPTIANTGVLSVAAGAGISVGGTASAPSIENTGVRSWNGQTGDVTFSSGPPTISVFTNSGTWTKPAGLKAARVRVVGGGGTGGARGTYGSGKSVSYGGGAGGGAGGYSEKLIQASSLGSTESVTVGGGSGTSSFGAHCSATGGATGGTGSSPGGAGGSGSGGDINIGGSAGSSTGTSGSTGGSGGSSALGGGGTAASAGRVYGGGGGGALSSGGQAGGAAGIVIVEHFF